MPNTLNQRDNYSNNKDEIQSSKQTINRFLWLKNNFFYCLMLTALLWIVAICYYIEQYIGWSSILALTPIEFGSFMLMSIVPLLLLWFILAYIERSSSLDANAQLFHKYVTTLMYPDSNTEQNARAIALAIREQIQLLQKENQKALQLSSQIKDDLERNTLGLSQTIKQLDEFSIQTLSKLNENIKDLVSRCDYITDKTANSTDKLKECTTDITRNSDNFLSKVVPVLEEISALSSNIKNGVVANKDYLSEIRTQLAMCADLGQNFIKDMLIKSDENLRKIEKAYNRTAEEYDGLYRRIDTSISSVEGRVEEQKHLVQAQTQVINHNSELLNNQLSKYGKTIAVELDKLIKNSFELEKMTKKQISVLKSVNQETGLAVQGIGDVFDEKRLEIERRSEYAINSMQNVVVALNKETEKLTSFTMMTQAKNAELKNISETIVDKIGDISNKLALKTDNFKDKAVEVIEKFTEAGDLISRSTDKMNAASSLVVNNSQQSARLWEEQNIYITNTLANLDIIKEKLGQLRGDVIQTSKDITQTLSSYEKHITTIEKPIQNIAKIEPLEQKFDRDQFIGLSKSINQTLRNMGINAEKIYEKKDMFNLWDKYLKGEQKSFIDAINKTLSHKHINTIRKSFDDNADFHNKVIRYLFLMDILIKDILNSEMTSRDEAINLSVNMSFDKIYFILVKALNSTD